MTTCSFDVYRTRPLVSSPPGWDFNEGLPGLDPAAGRGGRAGADSHGATSFPLPLTYILV